MKLTRTILNILKELFGDDFEANKDTINAWASNALEELVAYDKPLKGESKDAMEKRLSCNEVYNDPPNISPLANCLRTTFNDMSHLTDWQIIFNVYKNIKDVSIVSDTKKTGTVNDGVQAVAENQSESIKEEHSKDKKETSIMPSNKNESTVKNIDELQKANGKVTTDEIAELDGKKADSNLEKAKEKQITVIPSANVDLNLGGKSTVIAAAEVFKKGLPERIKYTNNTKVLKLISRCEPVVARLTRQGTRVGNFANLMSGKKIAEYVEKETDVFKANTGWEGVVYKVGDPVPNAAAGAEGAVATFANESDVLRFMYPKLAKCTEKKQNAKKEWINTRIATMDNLRRADAFRRALDLLKNSNETDYLDVVLPAKRYTFNGAIIDDGRQYKNVPVKSDKLADIISKYGTDKLFINTVKVDEDGNIPANVPVIQISIFKSKKKDTDTPGSTAENIIRKHVTRIKNGKEIVTNGEKFDFAYVRDMSNPDTLRKKFVMGMPLIGDTGEEVPDKLIPASYYFWKDGKVSTNGKSIKAKESVHKINLGVEYYPIKKEKVARFKDLELDAPKDSSIGNTVMPYSLEAVTSHIEAIVKQIKDSNKDDDIEKLAGKISPLIKVAAAAAADVKNFNEETDTLRELAASVIAEQKSADAATQQGVTSEMDEA